ncbi:hypothetical protein OCH239_05510 [Roseivivax halodurans JCM 10272]|uniref:Uncharacterized protein n=1 Tax=Roseivivax halodurans JCM 10272 TaxID=1449350 RepID=X7EDD4_9RHOB|nr:hypothetical protein [Roseivivax halodurans]ETX14099.1 hypothetical protein OCH239_05510 [Roseivivax halodurans JCM 10272]
MSKQEIELERTKSNRAWRRAQVLELVVGLAIVVWVVGKFGMAI